MKDFLKKPVLIVDDYNTMIRIIRNLLKQIGFNDIDDASDGETALKKMREKEYGLVLSDWTMEPMTGYDLLKAIRADVSLATMPLIMILPESRRDSVAAARSAGANAYIFKPFNAMNLQHKIEAIFEPAS